MNFLSVFKPLLQHLLTPTFYSILITFSVIYIVQKLFRGNSSGCSNPDCATVSINVRISKKDTVNEIRRRRKSNNLPPPYPTGWFAIGTSSSLKPGDVKPIFAFGQDLVIWRGLESGHAFVADAFCPHLGAHLGIGGKVFEDCVQCPFHHWQYDGGNDGQLSKIPHNSGFTPAVKLRMWPSCEKNDLIFVWNSNNPENEASADTQVPIWEIPLFPKVLSGIQFGLLETTIYTHIQDIVENGADFSHVKTLHSTLANMAPWLINILSLKEIWHPEFKPGGEAERHEANYRVDYNLEAFGGRFKFGRSTFLGKQYGPGLFLYEMTTPLGKLIITETVTPVEVLNSRIILQFYRESGWSCLGRLTAPLLMRMYINDFNKDVVIWNRKCTPRTPEFVSSDATIKSFRRYYSQFY